MGEDILIVDTGGGPHGTVAARAWVVTETTSHNCDLRGHQSPESKPCPVVNALAKATIKGRDTPILLKMNYVTLVDDPDECESLCQPYDLVAHGIKMDLLPPSLGGEGGMLLPDEGG